jgi:hypothetical protein
MPIFALYLPVLWLFSSASFRTSAASRDDLPKHLNIPYFNTHGFETKQLLNGTFGFQSWLYAKQNPDNCTASQFVAYAPTYRPERDGLGALMKRHLRHLLFTLDTNRVALFASVNIFRWADVQGCGKKLSLECYFEPLSTCAPFAVAKNTKYVGTQLFLGPKAHSRMRVALKHLGHKFPKHGRDWVLAQLMAYVTRPNPRLQRDIEAEYTAVFPTGKPDHLLHLYVRYGDKVWLEGAANYYPLGTYVKAVEKAVNVTFAAKHPHVFVATETAWVIPALQSNFSNFHWYYSNHNRSTRAGVLGSEIANSHGASRSARAHLTNLFLGLLGEAIVCLWESNWCNTLQTLQSFWSPRAVTVHVNEMAPNKTQHLRQVLPPDMRPAT